MKISKDKLELSGIDAVGWEEVKHLRLLNNKLVLVLQDNSTVELPPLHPGTIDEVFRTYESYLRAHPKKSQI